MKVGEEDINWTFYYRIEILERKEEKGCKKEKIGFGHIKRETDCIRYKVYIYLVVLQVFGRYWEAI